MMKHIPWKIGTMLVLLGAYTLLFYFVFTHQYRLDFSSLYSACQTLAEGNNPYRVLFTTYLPTVKQLPANLNPPSVLWMLSPLTWLQYDNAVAIWSGLSFILGLVGAGIAFNYVFTPDFLKKNWLNLYLIYLASFATIMDTAIAQFGALLLFFIMSGYHLYMKNRHYSAGLMWGMIISIKLFPALLFVYVLVQKRYRVFMIMLSVVLLMWLIPLFIYGTTIYTEYFSMMSRVLWYGDSWNASIYGMIFRLLVDITSRTNNLMFIKLLYILISCTAFIFYLNKVIKIEKKRVPHQSFCLTLVMMLLLSPFGWLYYFPLLTFPLALTWLTAVHEKPPQLIIPTWFLCLFFINFPIDYIPASMMPSLMGKLSFYSFHFYGLLLLLYLTCSVSGTSSRVPGTSSRVPGTSSRVPGTSSRVPGTSSRVPGTSSRVQRGISDRTIIRRSFVQKDALRMTCSGCRAQNDVPIINYFTPILFIILSFDILVVMISFLERIYP